MTIRNRGYATIRELKDLHGVSVSLGRDGSLLLTAIDSRGVTDDAARLAKIFKQAIIAELKRKGSTCNASA